MGIESGTLDSHPNFEIADIPDGLSIGEVVAYTLNYAANLVSPPMVPDETENRECVDVARQIRESAGVVLHLLDRVNDIK